MVLPAQHCQPHRPRVSQAEDQRQHRQRQLREYLQTSPVPVTSERNGGDYIGGNGGLHGRILVHGKHGRRAGTPGETDRGTRKGTQRVGNAWIVRALAGGGGSTALMAIAEEYEGSDVFGKNDRSIKLLVDSGASDHYLEDRPAVRLRAVGGTAHTKKASNHVRKHHETAQPLQTNTAPPSSKTRNSTNTYSIQPPHTIIPQPVHPSFNQCYTCLLYTSPSPRDRQKSRMPSSA